MLTNVIYLIKLLTLLIETGPFRNRVKIGFIHDLKLFFKLDRKEISIELVDSSSTV